MMQVVLHMVQHCQWLTIGCLAQAACRLLRVSSGLHVTCSVYIRPSTAGVVRAEDARLLGDMSALRRQHRRLADLNRDMWGEHSKRAANQAELVQGLKAINLMIQQAAKLRVGPAQARVVAACRAAIKANNLQALSKVVCEGSAAAGV